MQDRLLSRTFINIFSLFLIVDSRSLNSHIRSDKKNRLGLRTEMRQSDVDVIKDAGRGILNRDVVRHLKAKVDRDPMYHPVIISV